MRITSLRIATAVDGCPDDGVARLAASALRVFADDVRGHERGPCLAARGRPVFTVPSGPARAAGPAGAAMARAWKAPG